MLIVPQKPRADPKRVALFKINKGITKSIHNRIETALLERARQCHDKMLFFKNKPGDKTGASCCLSDEKARSVKKGTPKAKVAASQKH